MPVTYNFTSACMDLVYELEITANVNAGATSAKVEQLKGTSSLVTSPPPGTVYKNVNVWLGTSGFAVPANIKEGIIRFKVRNSWLSDENAGPGDVTMLRWDGQWNPLETKQIKKDNNFTYFEAKTSAFSPFAISAKVTEIAPTVTAPTPTPSTTATSTATVPGVTPIAKPPSMTWVYALVLIVLAAIAVYLYTATKKKEVKK